jgi:hypothetical protein
MSFNQAMPKSAKARRARVICGRRTNSGRHTSLTGLDGIRELLLGFYNDGLPWHRRRDIPQVKARQYAHDQSAFFWRASLLSAPFSVIGGKMIGLPIRISSWGFSPRPRQYVLHAARNHRSCQPTHRNNRNLRVLNDIANPGHGARMAGSCERPPSGASTRDGLISESQKSFRAKRGHNRRDEPESLHTWQRICPCPFFIKNI